MVFLKSLGAKILAKKAAKTIQKWASNPIETQQKIFQNLILMHLFLLIIQVLIFELQNGLGNKISKQIIIFLLKSGQVGLIV